MIELFTVLISLLAMLKDSEKEPQNGRGKDDANSNVVNKKTRGRVPLKVKLSDGNPQPQQKATL